VNTPFEVNVKYHREEGNLIDPTVFRQLIGT
jgi:hypothetical protein